MNLRLYTTHERYLMLYFTTDLPRIGILEFSVQSFVIQSVRRGPSDVMNL